MLIKLLLIETVNINTIKSSIQGGFRRAYDYELFQNRMEDFVEKQSALIY
jgi:hypothetical protein